MSVEVKGSKEGIKNVEDGERILSLESKYLLCLSGKKVSSIQGPANCCQVKDYTAPITYNHLLQAARDAGALREAKDKLEKRVEELTWRLDVEKHLRV